MFLIPKQEPNSPEVKDLVFRESAPRSQDQDIQATTKNTTIKMNFHLLHKYVQEPLLLQLIKIIDINPWRMGGWGVKGSFRAKLEESPRITLLDLEGIAMERILPIWSKGLEINIWNQTEWSLWGMILWDIKELIDLRELKLWGHPIWELNLKEEVNRNPQITTIKI